MKKWKRPFDGFEGMTSSPPDSRTLFIDRNSGGRTFRDYLTAEGLTVVLHDEEFLNTAADEDWLPVVGKKGWIVVTGDDDTTRSPLFLAQLESSQAFVFVLLGLNGATRAEKARCILDAHVTMIRLIAQTQPPALWRIGRDGAARKFDFGPVLSRMRQRRKS